MLPDELIYHIYYLSLIQKPYCTELKLLVSLYIQDIVNDTEDDYPIFINVDKDFRLGNKNVIQGICCNLGLDIAFAQNLINNDKFFVVDRDFTYL